MHAQALAYISAQLPPEAHSVLEFGARNINGSPRDLVPTIDRYVGVDISDGAGVDVVHDAATVRVKGRFDVVICAEVFEHAPDWECLEMLNNAHHHLRKGGKLIATMAGVGRAPHSARDGADLQPDEFYRNVTAETLRNWLRAAGFLQADIDVVGPDIRCVAVK